MTPLLKDTRLRSSVLDMMDRGLYRCTCQTVKTEVDANEDSCTNLNALGKLYYA